MFGKKKDKRTEAEKAKEREQKVQETARALKVQILSLEKKKDFAFNKVCEARAKGLKEQEMQARNLMKQAMASYKQVSGMLMTLELAMEQRDLAALNVNFFESMNELSDFVIDSSKKLTNAKTKKSADKFTQAMFYTKQQSEKIDSMLEDGNYAAVMSSGDSYSEFDDEIDSMLTTAELRGAIPAGKIR